MPDAADSASNVGSGKNVTIRIDGEGTNIEFNHTLAHMSPTVPVVCQTKDTAEAVHKIGSCKDVAVGTDGEGSHKVRKEPVVNPFPALTVVAGSKRADPIGASEDGPVKLGRDRPDIFKPLFTAVQLSPLSVDRKTPLLHVPPKM